MKSCSDEIFNFLVELWDDMELTERDCMGYGCEQDYRPIIEIWGQKHHATLDKILREIYEEQDNEN